MSSNQNCAYMLYVCVCVLVLSLKVGREVRMAASHEATIAVTHPIMVISLATHIHTHSLATTHILCSLAYCIQCMHPQRTACTHTYHSFRSLYVSLFLQWLTGCWVISMQLETFTGDKIHWNKNCSGLLRKHSTLQGAAAALPWQR